MLDHLGDRAVIARDHPAVAERIRGAEGQNYGCRRIGGVQPVQHPRHRFRADERHVAVEHEHVAIEPGERCPRLRHRMPRAELFRLHRHACAVPRGERLYLLTPRTHDDDLGGRLQRLHTVQQMGEHRLPGDRVQHLVQRGAHPRALAGGKNHGGERAGRRGETWFHGTSALPRKACQFHIARRTGSPT
jgi:hypothetical protein